MSRKKRDRQRREKKITKRRQLVKQKIKEIWPALSDALENPAVHAALEKDGLLADMTAIKRLADEVGIFIAVASDGRARFHNLEAPGQLEKISPATGA